MASGTFSLLQLVGSSLGFGALSALLVSVARPTRREAPKGADLDELDLGAGSVREPLPTSTLESTLESSSDSNPGASRAESLPAAPGSEAVGPSLTEAVLAAALSDPSGLFDFVRETRCRLSELVEGKLTPVGARQTLLTLVASSQVLQLRDISSEAERVLLQANTDQAPSPSELAALLASFASLEALLAKMDALDPEEQIQISSSDLDALTDLAESSSDGRPVAERLARLRQEPTRRSFRKLRKYAELVAEQRGQMAPQVTLVDEGVYLSRERFLGLWAGLLHLIDNALTHGFESKEERALSGKPERGQLTLRSKVEGSQIWIEVADDGRGIDWAQVGEKARKARLRSATREDLVLALRSGKVGVRNGGQAGIGLSAVVATVEELHGSLTVISSAGRGTTVRVTLPMRSNLAVFVPSLNPRHAESAGLLPELIFKPEKAVG